MKIYRIYYSLILQTILIKPSSGQQFLQDLYEINITGINPSYAGENGGFGLKASLGNQFNGTIKPNQTGQMALLDWQLKKDNALAFQGYRANRSTLVTSGLNLNYSQTFRPTPHAEYKLGVVGGFEVLPDFIGLNNSQQFYPYLGLGGLYYSRGLIIGLAKPKIFSKTSINGSEYKPMHLQLGYIFELSEGLNLSVQLLDFYEFKESINSFDIMSKIYIQERLGIGLNYRQNKIQPLLSDKNNVLIPSIEYYFEPNFALGLSYNSSTQFYSNKVGGINEVSNIPGIVQFYVKYSSEGRKSSTRFSRYL